MLSNYQVSTSNPVQNALMIYGYPGVVGNQPIIGYSWLIEKGNFKKKRMGILT